MEENCNSASTQTREQNMVSEVEYYAIENEV